MSDRDNITLPREVAYQVPLHELLESVPLDARLEIDDADGKGTRFIPVGRLCREAATALRTALAAEQPKQEPVAWMESPHGAIRANLDYRFNWPSQLHWQIPLYAAPPDAPTVKESLTHPGYVIGNHWFETAYERLCAGEAEDAILEDYELVREPRLRDLRRDAERYRYLRSRDPKEVFNKSGKAAGVWIDWEDDLSGLQLLTGDDADAAIDAAMEASTAPASAAADSSTAPEAKP